MVKRPVPAQQLDPQALEQLQAIHDDLQSTMIADRHKLSKQIQKLIGHKRQAVSVETLYERVLHRYQQSTIRFQQRLKNLPTPSLMNDLPVLQYQGRIIETIKNNQVVVIAGETGSGKTTQLPQLCLAMGRGVAGQIGHTQPRRIAARSVAERIAQELNSTPGQWVGYKVRFTGNVSEEAYIKIMTDGILLAEMQGDTYLNQYDTLIIDEAHERNLNIDFLLGYLKTLLPKRPELKLIVTSATIDTERFARHFSDAPVIEVSGRTYPVEVRYRPIEKAEEEDEQGSSLQLAILNAIRELDKTAGRGDTLVFLSGERDIRDIKDYLDKQLQHTNSEILPLYSRLSSKDQGKVFQPSKSRRIILSTNIAETSLTVPGIRYVIDTGLARINRYNYRNKVQRLPIEKISQANADQRKGRCGRVSDGICVRLYSEQDFEQRSRFTDPEIKRVNLASVILRMKSLRLGHIEQFPFLEPPDERYVRDGYKLLNELSALDHHHRLTRIGKQLAKMPIDPKLGRMLLEAARRHALKELLIICSALSIQDPRERPGDQQQAADEKHALFYDEKSDFLFYINLWRAFREQARLLSNNKLRKWCLTHFLSFQRMREWLDVHSQLQEIVRDLGEKQNQQAAGYDDIHCAVLTGLLGNIGLRKEKTEYMGARNVTLQLFPGSSLIKKPPKWIVAAELIETARLYASTVASILPGWLETIASHLSKHHYSEPHWDAESGRVIALEKITLYGLPVAVDKRVNYEAIAPIESREIFIRAALASHTLDCKAYFMKHNRQLIEEVRAIEDKKRRKGILVGEDVFYQFYDERIPSYICNATQFRQWIKKQEQQDKTGLCMQITQLVTAEKELSGDRDRPDHLEVNGINISLEYVFDLDAQHDGINALIPHVLLNQLPDYPFEWLVPGMLPEKVIAIIKALPKKYRRNFVPAPEYATACIDVMQDYTQPLIPALAGALHKMTGVTVPNSVWEDVSLPDYLNINFKVIDSSGNVLTQGRDLNTLKLEMKDRGATMAPDLFTEQQRCTQWEFGEIPDTKKVNVQGHQLTVYPALVDKFDSVSLHLFENRSEAITNHRQGLIRLYRITQLKKLKYVEKNLPGIQDICFNLQGIMSREEIVDELLSRIIDSVLFRQRQSIRSEKQFTDCVENANAMIMQAASGTTETLLEVSRLYKEVKTKINGKLPLSWMLTVPDIASQLEALIHPGFIKETPANWFEHMVRYLKGINIRLNKLEQSPQKDQQRMQQIKPLWQKYLTFKGDATIRSKYEEELEQYHWMLQEMRISLFAQELGTSMPVSINKLNEYVNVFTDS